jgi:hypothetical protein
MPNLATVNPAMDHTEEVLADVTKDERYDLAIWEAIGLARRTLNRYYSLTDSSEVSPYHDGCICATRCKDLLIIPIVLHP